MKPAKGLYPFAAWLMRIAILFISYVFFFDVLKTFNFSSLQFYIAAAFCIFATLLFIGGFLSNSNITVLSSFFLFGISVYKCIMAYQDENLISMSIFLTTSSAMLMLMSIGNKR